MLNPPTSEAIYPTLALQPTPKSSLRSRPATWAGIACLVATFLLMSGGVHVVRAESGDESNMSIDPALTAKAAKAAPTPAVPPVPADNAAAVERPGVPGVEVAPGVIVLNTRGYNYGPGTPGNLDPAAMAVESATK